MNGRLGGEQLGSVRQAAEGPPLCNGDGGRKQPLPSNVRRHVILIIGDGLQLEDEIAVSRCLCGEDSATSWDEFPYHGYVTTWDVTTYNTYADAAGVPSCDPETCDPLVGYDPSRAGARPYPLEDPPDILEYLQIGAGGWFGWWNATDSAAAATAMSTGVKTEAGKLAWGEAGPLETVGEKMRDARAMAFGVVSTQPFTAATPAGFSSHNESRHAALAIADEIIPDTQPDVVIGGGHPTLSDKEDYAYLHDALSSSTDYVFVERSAGQDGGAAVLAGADEALAQGKKLFGLSGTDDFGGSLKIGVAADDPGNPSVTRGTEDPTLAQAAEAAMLVLSQNPSGFFLMIEQADIDTANHDNDYAQKIACVVELEEAVAKVVEYIDQPGDDVSWENTVVIVVADHATGHMRLNPEAPLGKGDLPTQEAIPWPSCWGCGYFD